MHHLCSVDWRWQAQASWPAYRELPGLFTTTCGTLHHKCIQAQACICLHKDAHAHTHTHVYTHAHARTRTHTHTHTPPQEGRISHVATLVMTHAPPHTHTHVCTSAHRHTSRSSKACGLLTASSWRAQTCCCLGAPACGMQGAGARAQVLCRLHVRACMCIRVRKWLWGQNKLVDEGVMKSGL